MASLLGWINEETPRFDLLKKADAGYEIRRYHRQLRASVTFADTTSEGAISQRGFRELAGYIFGGNKKRAVTDGKENDKIAMTAPVITETNASSISNDKIAMTAPVMTDSDQSNKTTTMSFILPSKYQSLEELPIPNDSNVKIEVVERYTVAALRFSGRWTPEATDFQTKRLLEMLRSDKQAKLTVESEAKVEPKIARYNPPWTLPFLRTNEVMIPVYFTSEA